MSHIDVPNWVVAMVFLSFAVVVMFLIASALEEHP